MNGGLIKTFPNTYLLWVLLYILFAKLFGLFGQLICPPLGIFDVVAVTMTEIKSFSASALDIIVLFVAIV